MSTQLAYSSEPATTFIRKKGSSPFSRLFSPLWLFLALTLIVRIYLIIHTNGVIEGDEALIGIQAEHILHGEHPTYTYGLAYMGSSEAYVLALIFALIGPSSWVLRLEPTVLSLIVVALTWKFASDLIKKTTLSTYAKRSFVWSATLVAALLPLYDLVIEMRAWGAWVDVFIVMLLLLLSAFHLVERWREDASLNELAWRWVGLGFLIGLGFWLYPLVAVAVAASALWILGGFLSLIVRKHKQNVDRSSSSLAYSWKGLFLSILTLPAALIGLTPALYWGAHNNWANLTFIFQLNPNTTSLGQRLKLYRAMAQLYATCVGPRVIGGRVTFESGLLYWLHSFSLYMAVSCIGFCFVACICSYIWKNGLLTQIRQIAALPLLFGALTVVFFCINSASTSGLGVTCDSDFAGRYASPIGLALPFFFASVLAAAIGFLQGQAPMQFSRPRTFLAVGRPLVLVLFLIYLGTQLFTYGLSDPGYTFQSPYAMSAPVSDDSIIAYLQQNNITYAWANASLAYPITFETDSRIIVMDPYGAIHHVNWLNRIPANTEIVLQADRPSLLAYAASSDRHPALFDLLEGDKIVYKYARFPSSPGMDVIVVTPINKNIPVFTNPGYFG